MTDAELIVEPVDRPSRATVDSTITWAVSLDASRSLSSQICPTLTAPDSNGESRLSNTVLRLAAFADDDLTLEGLP